MKENEAKFENRYPDAEEGVHYYIRMRTLQVNESKASVFVLKAAMNYGAVVLFVICFTILSQQQLLDAAHYRYRRLYRVWTTACTNRNYCRNSCIFAALLFYQHMGFVPAHGALGHYRITVIWV